MDTDIFNMYLKAMNQIKSEEILESFSVESYTKLKDDDRKKLHKSVYKSAFPFDFDKPKNVVKLTDLKKVLRG